jgi:hypothetical protein
MFAIPGFTGSSRRTRAHASLGEADAPRRGTRRLYAESLTAAFKRAEGVRDTGTQGHMWTRPFQEFRRKPPQCVACGCEPATMPGPQSNPAGPARGMAQSGSASALGAEGRGFESLCPDHAHKGLSRGYIPASGNVLTKYPYDPRAEQDPSTTTVFTIRDCEGWSWRQKCRSAQHALRCSAHLDQLNPAIGGRGFKLGVDYRQLPCITGGHRADQTCTIPATTLCLVQSFIDKANGAIQ